jgi:hypothetical protein
MAAVCVVSGIESSRSLYNFRLARCDVLSTMVPPANKMRGPVLICGKIGCALYPLQMQ